MLTYPLEPWPKLAPPASSAAPAWQTWSKVHSHSHVGCTVEMRPVHRELQRGVLRGERPRTDSVPEHGSTGSDGEPPGLNLSPVRRHRHLPVEDVGGRVVLEIAGGRVLEAQQGGAENLDAGITGSHDGRSPGHPVGHDHRGRQIDRGRFGGRRARAGTGGGLCRLSRAEDCDRGDDGHRHDKQDHRERTCVETVSRAPPSQVYVARYSWTERTALDPSPTAAATRFIDPSRTSPTANTPAAEVSNGKASLPAKT